MSNEESEKKFVVYQGVRMIDYWPERIEKAQTQTHYLIESEGHERVRYGNESDDWGADKHACHDCGVIKGQFHVVGCDVERCPVCEGQAFGCDCEYDGDDNADDE